MSLIAGTELLHLIQSGVVGGMVDEEIQTQMCGVELTLGKVEKFESSGALDYDNRERLVAKTSSLDFEDSGWIHLSPGPYLITFNEIVSVPNDVAALARPRSSLLRSGATLETALWDPGYRGRSQSLLLVHNPHGLRLKQNARLMQLIFFRLSSQAGKTYSGAYQGENL